jgi:hypothetical protein
VATPTIREVVHTATSGVAATVTTGAGTAVDDILICFSASDFYLASDMVAPTGTSGTWTQVATTADLGTNNSHMKVWWRKVTAGGAQTVTVSPHPDEDLWNTTYVITGADTTSPIDDAVSAATDPGASANHVCPAVSPTTSDALLLTGLYTQVFSLTNYTAPSGITKQNEDDNSSTGASGSKALTSSGSTGTFTWVADIINCKFVSCTVAVKGASAATSIPYNPQRSTPQRDPGGAWWIQRDRRDANTVATAANPLVSPLDSAWQAGSRYWHLYDDSADAAPRTWQSLQRNYISDPNLLAPVTTDPLTLAAGVGGDLWRRYNAPDFADRREVPQQPIRESNPSLLGTALLENELLGGADSARHAQAAAFVDRREVPQQRPYVSDPLLLTTAELENELLGGADTAKRANVPATHAPRWWMPQQPPREGYSPGLLDDALLENELLGGADDRRRRAQLAATHVDRREVPQQPNRWTVYFDAGPDSPPLTLSWGAGGRYWALYNQAGWQPDRREVPQQRAYISDPSTYPTVPPTDPLTVAWGAGGHYWLLYNTAGLYVDRRLVPQQRRYISDPGLLLTALLENELLGGADDIQRHRSVFSDRREVPQQRAYVSDPSLFVVPPADPLLVSGGVGGDLWRRYNLAVTNTDRRETAAQPPRWMLFFSVNQPGQLFPSTASGGMAAATAAALIVPSTSGGDA